MTDAAGPLRRAWTYLQERFPLAAHGPLVLVFSASSVAVAHRLVGEEGVPSALAFAVAFVSVLGFFFQLRVADEFKDFETDAAHRPYRPVPRGLVTLRALAVAGVMVGVLQLGLALVLDVRLLPVLLLVWGFGALMTAEFFVPKWLESRPFAVLWTHGLVVPLIAAYAAACGGARLASLPPGLFYFFAAVYCSGLVVEVGRKVRAPADEEAGVTTYSAVWGRGRAVALWLGVLFLSFACALATAHALGVLVSVALVLGVAAAFAAWAAVRMLRDPALGTGKAIETAAAVWTLATYAALGLFPFLFR